MGPFVVVGDDEQAEFAENFAQQAERRRRFQKENRPDDVPDHTDYSALPVEQRAALDSVIEAALEPLIEAYESGLQWKTIVRHLNLRFDQAMWKKLKLDEASRPLSREEARQLADEVSRKGEARREGTGYEGERGQE